ncbi:hypothetical protein OKJ48_38865 [Streptomyces kunmingensis]|uniref:Uncharacterized protein n=1 Tax=Streptomyces kunmingensis TaxID=68225 RepID=A0ABU6CN33_9ACTN|nr:hypothetical protein [Streptomyces kunmingensis]MEB3966145.1 hypothetical protein [Streptomyces kunmingensis]
MSASEYAEGKLYDVPLAGQGTGIGIGMGMGKLIRWTIECSIGRLMIPSRPRPQR